MAKKTTTKKTSASKRGIKMVCTGPSIFEIANYLHNTVARHCDYCGRAMTPSDVNDYGSLCESCYMKEYYGK